MIIKFKLFEIRVEDIFSLKGDSDEFKKYKNSEFKYDSNLIEYVRINNKRINLRIKWNNDKEFHNILEKTIERTNLKSVSELNRLIRYGLKELYEKNYEFIEKIGNYCLYFKENDFSVLLSLKYIDNKTSEIYIYTLKSKLNYYENDIIIKLDTTL